MKIIQVAKIAFIGSLILVGSYFMIGFLVELNKVPTIPANLEELANYSERDLWKIREYYQCSYVPSFYSYDSNNYDVYRFDELKELKRFCDVVSGYWVNKYRYNKLDEALTGAERLKNRNQFLDKTRVVPEEQNKIFILK